MTTKSRAADEEPQPDTAADEQPNPVEEKIAAQDQSADAPIVDTDEPLNPTGVPGETFDAEPDASVEAAGEAGADQVQAQFDAANERGYFGETPDQDDRDRYTLRGQQNQ
jgi:hypothetical protein